MGHTRSRSRSRSPRDRRDRDQGRDREQERDRDRGRDREREREGDRERDRRDSRGVDRDRERDLDRGRGREGRSPPRSDRDRPGDERRHDGGRKQGGRGRGEDALPLPPPPPRGSRGDDAFPPPPPRPPGSAGPPGRRDERGDDERRGGRGRSDEGRGGDEGSEPSAPAPPKEQPNMGLSGKLAVETNKVVVGGATVVLKHVPPPEAAKPDRKWRLYCFKGEQMMDEPYYLHRMDHYLFGRELKVVDICCAHPSISKQHAVLQFRRTEKPDSMGLPVSAVRPYLMDLGSINGTFLNGERMEAERYYELLEKDAIKFGLSSREYILLHDQSAGL